MSLLNKILAKKSGNLPTLTDILYFPKMHLPFILARIAKLHSKFPEEHNASQEALKLNCCIPTVAKRQSQTEELYFDASLTFSQRKNKTARSLVAAMKFSLRTFTLHFPQLLLARKTYSLSRSQSFFSSPYYV